MARKSFTQMKRANKRNAHTNKFDRKKDRVEKKNKKFRNNEKNYDEKENHDKFTNKQKDANKKKERKAENFKHTKNHRQIENIKQKNEKKNDFKQKFDGRNDLKKKTDEKTQPLTIKSQLLDIYTSETQDIDLEAYESSLTPSILREEIFYLGHLLKQEDFDRKMVIFYIENVTPHASKQNLVLLLNILFSRLFEQATLKKSVFLLKILHILTQASVFVPMSVQLLSLYKIAKSKAGKSDENEKKNDFNRKVVVDYTKLKLPSEILNSTELRDFIKEESLALLFANLNCISNTIGFPEFVEPILNVLQEFKEDKSDNFYDDVNDLVSRLDKQCEMIKEKRVDIEIKCTEDVVEFERSTSKMIE